MSENQPTKPLDQQSETSSDTPADRVLRTLRRLVELEPDAWNNPKSQFRVVLTQPKPRVKPPDSQD